jgi:hypothetical protein
MVQTVNRDVSDYTRLTLAAEIKVVYQSLSGGGWVGVEYPAMLRITYRDALDNDHIWMRGFYYDNPAGLSTPSGIPVPRDRWVTAAFDLLSEAQPKPVFVKRVEVLAGGHEYLSLIRNVRLVGE